MEDGVWRTVGGRRIFIKEGQSLSDAMRNSGKFGETTNDIENDKNKSAYESIAYHGSKIDFDDFDEDKIGTNKRIGNAPLNSGKGFYFTEEESVAQSYGNNLKKVKLVIDKPLDFENYKAVDDKTLNDAISKYEQDNIEAHQYMMGSTREEAEESIKNFWKDKMKKPYGVIQYADSRSHGDYKMYVKIMEDFGYDGIVKKRDHEIVALKKEQIRVIK